MCTYCSNCFHEILSDFKPFLSFDLLKLNLLDIILNMFFFKRRQASLLLINSMYKRAIQGE